MLGNELNIEMRPSFQKYKNNIIEKKIKLITSNNIFIELTICDKNMQMLHFPLSQ